MAGGKQTPRQRMIGILYLVLLGLIALDVPDSLLDSFKNISDSLNASKVNVQTGINNTFLAFEKTKLLQQPERAKPIYDHAVAARNLADDLIKYIDSIKKILVDQTGGIDPATNDYKGRADLDVSVRVMVDDNKLAYELRKKINATRKGLLQQLAMVNPADTVGMNLALQANDPKKIAGFPSKNWEEANFGEGIPMTAAMTALIKIQADTRNSENDIVKKILGEVDQAQINLDKFQAVAVAPSSYVIAGQPYTAQVFLTAYDSKSTPDITVNGSKIPVATGRGQYSVNTSQEGVFTWVGNITVRQNNGRDTTYSTGPQTYQVARPSAVVSPTKMNVLYIGLPNPLAVSAPGVPKDKLHVSMTGGNISGSNGNYIGTVTNIGTATVTVSGEVSPGRTMTLGSTTFRIKRIPDPKAEFAGKSGGTTSAANIRAQDYVFANLENFEFDAKFSITHFTLLIIKPRQDAIILSGSGNTLTSEMHAAMNTVTPGTTIVFKDLVAVGPDNLPRGLDPIVISAN